MNPEQQHGPLPPPPVGEAPTPPPPASNPYDFITAPKKPAKQPKLQIGGSPLIKIALISSGALILIVIVFVLYSVIFAKSNDFPALISIAETQQELVRVAKQVNGQSSESIAGAAINTQLTITTQQENVLVYLKAHKIKIGVKDLALKKNSKTDETLRQATANSTFDIVFTQVMRQQIETYASQVKTASSKATGPTAKALLNTDYRQVQMLLQQWPSR